MWYCSLSAINKCGLLQSFPYTTCYECSYIYIFIARALFLRKHAKFTVAAMLTKEGGRIKPSFCVGFIIKIYRVVVD